MTDDTTPEDDQVVWGRSTMPTVADMILALMQFPKDAIVYPITYSDEPQIALYANMNPADENSDNDYVTDFPTAFKWNDIKPQAPDDVEMLDPDPGASPTWRGEKLK